MRLRRHFDEEYDYLDAEARAKLASWWHEGSQALATMSARARYIAADESGHPVQRDQPELVIAAIRELIEGLRERQ